MGEHSGVPSGVYGGTDHLTINSILVLKGNLGEETIHLTRACIQMKELDPCA